MIDSPQVATALCVDIMRVGRHYIRGPQRERVGSQQIREIFRFVVKPSFHDPLSVWVVEAQGELFRDSTSPSWVKGVIEHGNDVLVENLHENPLSDCLKLIDLTEYGGGITLDGVGYELAFETCAVNGLLCFANPRTPSLRNIESTMLNTAKTILAQHSIPGMAKAVALWGEYAEPGLT